MSACYDKNDRYHEPLASCIDLQGRIERKTSVELLNVLCFLVTRWLIMMAYAYSFKESFSIGICMLRCEAMVFALLSTTTHDIVHQNKEFLAAIDDSVWNTFQASMETSTFQPAVIAIYGLTIFLCNDVVLLGVCSLLGIYHLSSIVRCLVSFKDPMLPRTPLLPY